MATTALRTPVDGVLLRRTRIGIAVLLGLAVANGLFLYVLPGLADTAYAWSIKPPASAAFLGAGYVAGAAATGMTVFAATRWRSVQPLGAALAVLSVLLIGATIIHAGKFRWLYPPTWVWTGVYAIAPVAIAVLSVRQRRITTVPEADPRLRLLRTLSLIAGTVLAIGAIALYAAPVRLGAHWPWLLTPLLARAVASWYAMVGTALLACAVGLRRRHEVFIPYLTLCVWAVLLLAIPLLHAGDVIRHGTPVAVYVGGMAALLALGLYGLSRATTDSL
jgi:hypothetical protein